MTPVPLEIQRYLVRLWDETGPILERIRAEELRNLKHDPAMVDGLLELGSNTGFPPRQTSGLVEMQRIFMKARPKPETTDAS